MRHFLRVLQMWPFSRRDEPKLRVDRIVSLGALCEVAYQTRRLSRSGTAYPFDWWDTPFSAVLAVLEAGASQVFSPSNIVKMTKNDRGQPAFYSRWSDTIHQHEFPRNEDFLGWDEAEISRRLIPKYEALYARLVSQSASGTTLFVRQRKPDFDLQDEALEAALERLHRVLSGFAADPRVLLLDYAPVAPRPWLMQAQVPRYSDCDDLGSRRGWNEVFDTQGIACRPSGDRFRIRDLKVTFAKSR